MLNRPPERDTDNDRLREAKHVVHHFTGRPRAAASSQTGKIQGRESRYRASVKPDAGRTRVGAVAVVASTVDR